MIMNNVVFGGSGGGPTIGMVDLAADAQTITIPVDKLYSHLVLFPISIPNPNALLSSASVVPVCLTTPEQELAYNSTNICAGSQIEPGWYDEATDEVHEDGFSFQPFLWGVVSARTIVTFTETSIVAGYVANNGRKRSLAAGKYGYVAW